MKERYVRFLPHWHPKDRWIFVTWRLAGSPPPNQLREGIPEGKRFAMLDQEADRATTGPLWLKDPRIADVVQNKIISFAGTLYALAAWVIMANHVHFVILPQIPLAKMMQKLKGSTAYECNQLLGRTGAFWAIESYDHWLRTENELNRVIRYVERNPVNAGLVDSIEQWQWSSASQTKVCVTSASPELFARLPAQ